MAEFHCGGIIKIEGKTNLSVSYFSIFFTLYLPCNTVMWTRQQTSYWQGLGDGMPPYWVWWVYMFEKLTDSLGVLRPAKLNKFVPVQLIFLSDSRLELPCQTQFLDTSLEWWQCNFYKGIVYWMYFGIFFMHIILFCEVAFLTWLYLFPCKLSSQLVTFFPVSKLWIKKNACGKQRVAKLVEDTYRSVLEATLLIFLLSSLVCFI